MDGNVAYKNKQIDNVEISNEGHHIARLVVDLKHCALQQRPGRQAIDRIVVRRFFDDLDLACLLYTSRCV